MEHPYLLVAVAAVMIFIFRNELKALLAKLGASKELAAVQNAVGVKPNAVSQQDAFDALVQIEAFLQATGLDQAKIDGLLGPIAPLCLKQGGAK